MWRSIWTFRSFPPNTRRPWPNRKTYFELIDFLLSDLKLLCTAPRFKAGKIDRGRWKEHGVASSCAFASISHELCLFQIMMPARSNTIVWKKTMWSMAIILYFISRRTQWLESPYFVDEPPDQEHDTRSIRFVGMSSFKHLRQDLSVSKEQASAKSRTAE